jgi:hypothetical protein
VTRRGYKVPENNMREEKMLEKILSQNYFSRTLFPDGSPLHRHQIISSQEKNLKYEKVGLFHI